MYKILTFVLLWSSFLFSFGQNTVDSLAVKAPVKETVDTTPKRFAEKMPEFVGGEEAMFEFMAKEMKYPLLGEQQISGTVLVQFIVEKDGTITNAKVIVPLSPSLDKEALRVVNIMPEWKPGTNMGKPVRCYYLVPIRFSYE